MICRLEAISNIKLTSASQPALQTFDRMAAALEKKSFYNTPMHDSIPTQFLALSPKKHHDLKKK